MDVQSVPIHGGGEPVVNAYAQSADRYLAQRVLAAGPEQQAALLMEAGQLFLGKATKAINQNDPLEVRRCLLRVTDIINEAFCRLNHEAGGELVENLTRMYNWWSSEIMDASSARDTARLKGIASHMGEIRQAWEQLHEKQVSAFHRSEFHVGDQVV
jgi:flagellar protein FliS